MCTSYQNTVAYSVPPSVELCNLSPLRRAKGYKANNSPFFKAHLLRAAVRGKKEPEILFMYNHPSPLPSTRFMLRISH